MQQLKPYASVSAGYNLQEKSAPESYDDRCNMPAGFEAGLEHKSGLSYGARHESNYDCGIYSWNQTVPNIGEIKYSSNTNLVDLSSFSTGSCATYVFV